MNTLALFDIDGTLIKSSKAHWESFSVAFKKIFGVETSIDIIQSTGLTDQEIILRVLRKVGFDSKDILTKIDQCMQAMVDAFEGLIEKDTVIAFDGVR